MTETKKPRMNLKRYIVLVIAAFFIWVFCYLPSIYSIHQPAQLELSLSMLQQQRYIPKCIQPYNNTNILNPKSICEPYDGNNILNLVIVICTAIPNTVARQAIRSTFGKYANRQYGVKYYFLTGTTINETLNRNLADENAKFGDIIQENFIDTYNNLTLKTIMMLKWVEARCQRVKFVMKSDDDTFVNVPNLISYLNTVNDTKLLVGYTMENVEPIRDKNSKWYVSNTVFDDKFYPEYLSGSGYVMSRALVQPLYKTALQSEFFYLEDIFLTGMCASKLNVSRVDKRGFFFGKRKNDPCLFRTIITAHHVIPNEFYTVWNKMSQKNLRC